MNDVGTRVIGAAIEVHKALGPGLLESAYEAAFVLELQDAGFVVSQQVPIALEYKGRTLDIGFRADLVIEQKVLVELKSVEEIREVHKKQVQTYLKLTGLRLGYLMNFNSRVMREGIVRCVNQFPE